MIRSCLTAIAVLFFLTPLHSALAALPGPPVSYAQTSADGRHLLVIIAPKAPDPKEYPWLVDTLRDTYSQSGCYELCSDVPLWTVDWFEGNCHLSHDGRYLVECHLNPEPERGTPTSWAVKFYDHGHEIGSYDLADLVDYPALLWRHSYRWHWIDYWADDNEQIHDGRFYLRTSTRERYVFDITTGAIVEEHRFWRNVSTTAKFALFVCGGGLVLWYFGSRKRRLERAAMRRLSQSSATTRRSFRFSIRSLLIFMAICAVFAAVFRAAPHVGIFMTSALLPLVLIVALRPSRVVSTIRRCAYRGLIFISLLPFYVLSIGPVSVFLDYLDVEYDVRWAVIMVPYYPVYWLLTETSGYPMRALSWYWSAWG